MGPVGETALTVQVFNTGSGLGPGTTITADFNLIPGAMIVVHCSMSYLQSIDHSSENSGGIGVMSFQIPGALVPGTMMDLGPDPRKWLPWIFGVDKFTIAAFAANARMIGTMFFQVWV
jgi:hypothetical protein